MGTYIHAYAEHRIKGEWLLHSFGSQEKNNECPSKLFDVQNYTLFGWLANVRNYAKVPPLSPARGLPTEVSREVAWLANEASERGAGHFSWLGLRELLAFDYTEAFEDRRTGNGGSQYGDTYPVGMGQMTTFEEAFGQRFFDDLTKLKSLGEVDDVRIVFWFD